MPATSFTASTRPSSGLDEAARARGVASISSAKGASTVVDVSVVVVNWNTRDILRDCLRSIERDAGDVVVETIVVDNASHDGSADMVAAEFPRVRLIRNADNVGFAAGNNQGMELATGRFLLLLNSDTVVLDRAIERTVRFADARPDTGMVGCKTTFPDGRMQFNCYRSPSVLNLALQLSRLSRAFKSNRFFGRYRYRWWSYEDVKEVEGVAGCFMLVRREALEQVGPMAEHYFMYAEDADWCWRFRRKGWRIHYTPEAVIHHLHDASGSQAAAAMHVRYRKSMLMLLETTSGRLARAATNGLFLAAGMGNLARVLVLGLFPTKRSDDWRRERALALGAVKFHLLGMEGEEGASVWIRRKCHALTRLPKRLVALGLSTVVWAWDRVAAMAGQTHPNDGVILYYHAVKPHERPAFERQMHWLARRADVVSLDTLCAPHRARATVAITFDDAFDCVRRHALPVLRELQLPATVFAVSGNCGAVPTWEMADGHADRNEPTMTGDRLRAVDQMGLRVESHTATHADLASCDALRLRDELTRSRTDLERILGRPVTLLSVPYGSWSDLVIEAARDAGYARVCTTEPVPVSCSGDSFALGRFKTDPGDWLIEFKLKALGAYRWRGWRRRAAARGPRDTVIAKAAGEPA